MRIIERIDRYTGKGSFGGWASVVARNHCRMHVRKARARMRRAGPAALNSPDLPPDNVPDPAEEMLLQERRTTLYAAVQRLPERERDTVVLLVFDSRSIAEAAMALGISPASVRAALARAITRLRKMPEIWGFFLDDG